MLIPQFTIRWLLGVTVVVAVISSIAALAMQDHGWAVGICAALAFLMIAMFVYAGFFALLWLVSLVVPDATNRASLGRPPQAAMPGNTQQPMPKEAPVEAIVLD